MNDSEHVTKIMSTYGWQFEKNELIESRISYLNSANQKVTATFLMKKTFIDHFYYRHAIDSHNNLQYLNSRIDETCIISFYLLYSLNNIGGNECTH